MTAYRVQAIVVILLTAVHSGYFQGVDENGYNEWGEKVVNPLDATESKPEIRHLIPSDQQPTGQLPVLEGYSPQRDQQQFGYQDPANQQVGANTYSDHQQIVGSYNDQTDTNTYNDPKLGSSGYTESRNAVVPQLPPGQYPEPGQPQPEQLQGVQPPVQQYNPVYDPPASNQNVPQGYPQSALPPQPQSAGYSDQNVPQQPPPLVSVQDLNTGVQNPETVPGIPHSYNPQAYPPVAEQVPISNQGYPEPVQFQDPQSYNPIAAAQPGTVPADTRLQAGYPSDGLQGQPLGENPSQIPSQNIFPAAPGYQSVGETPQAGALPPTDPVNLPEHIYPQNLAYQGIANQEGIQQGMAPPMDNPPRSEPTGAMEYPSENPQPGQDPGSLQNDTYVQEQLQSIGQSHGSRLDDSQYPNNDQTGQLPSHGTGELPNPKIPTQLTDRYGQQVPPSQYGLEEQPSPPQQPYDSQNAGVPNLPYDPATQGDSRSQQYSDQPKSKYIYPEQMDFLQNGTVPTAADQYKPIGSQDTSVQGTDTRGYAPELPTNPLPGQYPEQPQDSIIPQDQYGPQPPSQSELPAGQLDLPGQAPTASVDAPTIPQSLDDVNLDPEDPAAVQDEVTSTEDFQQNFGTTEEPDFQQDKSGDDLDQWLKDLSDDDDGYDEDEEYDEDAYKQYDDEDDEGDYDGGDDAYGAEDEEIGAAEGVTKPDTTYNGDGTEAGASDLITPPSQPQSADPTGRFPLPQRPEVNLQYADRPADTYGQPVQNVDRPVDTYGQIVQHAERPVDAYGRPVQYPDVFSGGNQQAMALQDTINQVYPDQVPEQPQLSVSDNRIADLATPTSSSPLDSDSQTATGDTLPNSSSTEATSDGSPPTDQVTLTAAAIQTLSQPAAGNPINPEQNIPPIIQPMAPSSDNQLYPGQPMAPSSDNQLYPGQPMAPSSDNQLYPGQPMAPSGDNQLYPGQPMAPSGDNQLYPGQPMAPSGDNQLYPEQPMAPSGDNRMYPGQPMAPSGDNQMHPGQPMAPSGDNQLYSGQPMAPSGDNQMHPGQPTAPSGDNQLYPGQPMAPSGDSQMYPGHMVPSGDNRKYTGQPMAPSGENQLYPGQPMAPSGDSQMYPGQPMAPSGDNQMYPGQPMAPSGDNRMNPGQPIVPSGDNQLHPGQPMAPSGDNQLYPGQPMAPSGDSQMYPGQPMAPSGDNQMYPGQPSAPSGDNQMYPGQPIAPSGDNQMYPGQPMAPSGDNQMHPGQPLAPSGDNQLYSGQPMAPSGDSQMYPGQPMAPSGDNQLYPGQPIVPSGDNQPYPGQPIAPSGDNQMYLGQPMAPPTGDPLYPGQPINHPEAVSPTASLIEPTMSYDEESMTQIESIYGNGTGNISDVTNLPLMPSEAEPMISPTLDQPKPSSQPSLTPSLPTGASAINAALSTTLDQSIASAGISPTSTPKTSMPSDVPLGTMDEPKLPEVHPIDTNLFKVPENLTPEQKQVLLQQQQVLLEQQKQQLELQQQAEELIEQGQGKFSNLTSGDNVTAENVTADEVQAGTNLTTLEETSDEVMSGSLTPSTDILSTHSTQAPGDSTVKVRPSASTAGLDLAAAPTGPMPTDDGTTDDDFDDDDNDDEDDDEDLDDDEDGRLATEEPGAVSSTTLSSTESSREPGDSEERTGSPRGGDVDMMDRLEGLPAGQDDRDDFGALATDSPAQPQPSRGAAGVGKEAHRYVEPEQPGAGHFMAYFVTCLVIVILGYIVYHNRKKVVGVLVEGRNGSNGRRSRKAGYKQLAVTVEEAIPSSNKGSSDKDYIY